ncbi:MAG: hypothetical protein MI976_17710 [Pseudomonadales bacterium]|nr:hypothetical protein [Pseudomonadales bacterium]
MKNTPIPLRDSPLVGVWEAIIEKQENDLIQLQNMYIELTDEGYVAFHRVDCWKSLVGDASVWHTKDFKIDFMPVIKLNQEKLKAQWMPLTPKLEFSLDKWPQEINGRQQMTVDGIVLYRVPEASDRSQWHCDAMRSADRNV